VTKKIEQWGNLRGLGPSGPFFQGKEGKCFAFGAGKKKGK